MNLSPIKLCVLLCGVAANLCCVAQTNAWNGSWKVDPSTKKYDGANFSMTTDANGFTMTTPGRADDKTICDGQPRPNPDGSTGSCRKVESGYIVDQTKPDFHSTVSISPDGNTLTYQVDGVGSDGVHVGIILISRRVSGGPGVSGVWHPIRADMLPDAGIVTIQITGNTLLFKESNVDKPASFKLDGTESQQPYDQTGSATLVDPHTLKLTYRSKGKVNRENTFVLSEDGQTLTETDITPEPNASTYSAAYHKP